MRLSNRQVWNNNFPQRLQNQGYAVVSVDLRKHGESKGPDTTKQAEKPGDLKKKDYQSMVVGDLVAVKRFLYQEHQKERLNMRKTAIIGPGMGGSIALSFALYDWMRKPFPDADTLQKSTPRGQDIRALVLLSPEYSTPGLGPVSRSIKTLRDPEKKVASLVLSGSRDKLDKGAAQKISAMLNNVPKSEKRSYSKTYNTARRGTDLFIPSIDVEEQILAFLDLHLKQLGGRYDVWRNRQSPLVAQDNE
jgi:alpha-beta hydrolase superfamily lysophospholipase